MTPQETIKSIKLLKALRIFDAPSLSMSVDEAISALELKQQLADLGLTIEDVKAMKEKQIPKKTEIWRGQVQCPTCARLYGNYIDIKGTDFLKKLNYYDGYPHCQYCGQALDWSGDDET